MRTQSKIISLCCFLLIGCAKKNNAISIQKSEVKVIVKTEKAISTKVKSVTLQLSGVISEAQSGSYKAILKLPDGINSSEILNNSFIVDLPLPGLPQVNAVKSSSDGTSITASFNAPPRLLEKIKLRTRADLKITKGKSFFQVPFEAIISPTGNSAYVYIVSKNNKIEKIETQIIESTSPKVLIRINNEFEELNFIVAGQHKLFNGESVEISEKK